MNHQSSLLPGRNRLVRGFVIAATLWIVFLVVTGYTSVASLLDRVASSDVMKAASGGAWAGRIAWQVAGFVAMQILLHLAFAGLTWLLACASVIGTQELSRKFGRIVVGWFSLLAAAAIAYNAYWFPRTLIGAYYHYDLERTVGPFDLGPVIYWGVFLFAVLIAMRGAWVLLANATFPARRRALIGMGIAGALFVAVIALPSVKPGIAAAAASGGKPNIIILGIDSLRLEQLQRFGGSNATPNLDRFLANADLFTDTTSPVARTFPSWVSILTGRSPTVTNARFNLADRDIVRANPTIGDVLRQHGYRTIYSTDEVRFANIDESYGFDQVVTPQIGAADFVIGTYNELPLASMLINTRIAKWIFPFSYSNRGVATMFQPGTFVDRIRREVRFEQPTLFICHLTAAHWPYYTSDVPLNAPFSTPDDPQGMYRTALRTADEMFGEVLSILERQGALENALVIVLSDHGEAFHQPSDSFFDDTFFVEGLRAPIKLLDMGHGQSVLSKSQYHLLLSFRSFGGARRVGAEARDIAFPATAEDISPTILDFLAIPGDPLSATGRSLLPFLEKREPVSPDDLQRVRFTETDLSVLPGPGGRVDEVATARQNAIFFEIDPKTARMHIRETFAPLAAAYKERAAYSKDTLLAALPAGPETHQYLFFDFQRKHGKLLLARPGSDEPDAQRLWDALSEHFGKELKTPVAITPEDWPRLGREWEDFTLNRLANPGGTGQPGSGADGKGT